MKTTLLLLLTTLCAAGTALPGTARAGTDINPLAIRAHLGFLADDALQGRMTGTREYDIAANYVAAQFEAIGLKPGMGRSYLQPVPYASARLDIESADMSIERQGIHVPLHWQRDFVMSADRVRPHTVVRAPAVFVGYGIHAPDQGHDDYAGIDARGKIVVVVSGAPKQVGPNERAHYSSSATKARAAVAHGAVGYIGLRNSYQIGRTPWDEAVREAGLRPVMAWRDADGQASDHYPEIRGAASVSEAAAPALFAGSAHSYEDLMRRQAAGEAMPSFPLTGNFRLSRRSRIETVHIPNVIGVLPGSDPALRDEYVVYTGHLDHVGTGAPVDGDHIYNGAYDNAMGIALMIEAARVLAADPPRRSVLFIAVGGEERGLLGSDYYAHNPSVPIEQLVGLVNLDMPLFLYPLASVIGFGAEHSTMGPAIEAAVAEAGLFLAEDPLKDEVLFIRSDQYSFVKQGVPSVFLVPGFDSSDPAVDGKAEFFRFFGTHYHEPSDDLSRFVHWPSAVRFARANVRIGRQIANAEQRPRWNPGNFFGELYATPATAAPGR